MNVVDLTTPLSAATPTLELPDPFVNLIDFSIDYQSEYDDRGPFWKHANIHTGEHIGTHIDAPVHWISGRGGKDVSEIEPTRLVGPAVVIDFSERAADDPDLLIDVSDIASWESANGAFPDNCWLLVRTGWDSRGHDRNEFLNKYDGGSHTPGFTAECAQWLAERDEISGVGVETVGIDAGGAASLEPAFPMHYHLLGHDKYGLTSLKNLQRLPSQGAVIVVAPLPIEGGTGSPARVFAFVDSTGGGAR
ncbi:cyclase family protein [Brevibacterium atlanticum]|uniref:cyclase family protein n=1 Tax=Brevibacterium atlanticum TaxID=2697563 RepID=UPI001D19508C|nr:cyclase family protein [Brevibacterium atlanticum]